ncbi:hypothetical protein RB594_005468 [Gaeumannomyces avenae]
MTEAKKAEMATPQVPYAAQEPEVITGLVREMERHVQKMPGNKAFRIKKTRFKVLDSPTGIAVDSWRMQDWDYKRRDLPTYARGLFTTRDPKSGHYEIAVRGYDKFFNTGEVHATEWDNMRKTTQGPYELTLKENGCIIFIAGLEDDTLLVCSKHSTGPRSDADLSHAVAGERLIKKQLDKIGKTTQDLARELRARNVTAVAELCDDSFEEHILAYGPDKAGLYLHGINLNLPSFRTYASSLVQSFASDWGFKQVGLLTFEDLDSTKTFLDNVAETGAYDGRDVEGFVIRCRKSHDPAKVPYEDWFFKYKFEEPYLMYRQWRECTKALIASKPPKFKKHKKITEEYLLFARKRLATNPNLAKAYNQNHGIIALRDEFLKFKNLKGSDAANLEPEFGGEVKPEVAGDVILVPIATIGCGKTTIAVALSHLLDFGHVQNDNIQGKGRPPKFTKWVLDELKEHRAVVADRNNAQRHERKQILTDVKIQHPTAIMVALNFVHDDVDEVRKVTQGRVFARGDNHQTIQAASDTAKVVGIMEGFIGRFEPCNPMAAPDIGFDAIIRLDPTADSRANLETVIRELHGLYPNLITEVPSAEEMDTAIAVAIGDYQPEMRHSISSRGPNKNTTQTQPPPPPPGKKMKIEYISVNVPAQDVLQALEKAFKNTTPEQSRMYKMLEQTRRIQPQFHVTLIHKSGSDERPELWDRYSNMNAEARTANPSVPYPSMPEMGRCDVQLERVVFDDRIMSIVVRLVNPDGGEGWECLNKVPHITVGTRDMSIKPKESNDLLARWLDESTDGGKIDQIPFEDRPILKGTVKAVLSR